MGVDERMIAHIAEACFWLFRYLERVETTARLINSNQIFILDGENFSKEPWKPIIKINGHEKIYESINQGHHYANDAMACQFLTWEEKNPESIINAFKNARENARSIRDTISSELWNALNGFWLWLTLGEGRDLYNKNKHLFYEAITEQSHMFRGIFYCSMRQEEAFEFIHVGMMLERALQTARVLLIKMEDSKKGTEDFHSRYWLALLEVLFAREAFLKCPHYGLTRASVAEFLIFENSFPRAICFCLKQALMSFSRIRNYVNIDHYTKSEIELSNLADHLEHCSKLGYINLELNTHLRELIEKMENIFVQIQVDFFYHHFDDLYARL
jgi:uncharacterized alpha-E superfamily protein